MAKSFTTLLSILCLLTVVDSNAQDSLITHIEYFIDSDPGVGNGVVLFNGVPDDSISLQNLQVSGLNLSPGTHQMFIRAKNATGTWNVVNHRSFYVKPAEANFINTEVEYFVDTDPGLGNGVDIPVADSDTLSLSLFAIPTVGLPNGLHQLYVRSKNSIGVWNVPLQRAFYIRPEEVNFINTEVEYFVDTDPGVGNGTDIPISDADTLSLSSFVTPMMGVPPGIHHLFVRAKNSNGIWNTISQRAFYVNPAEVSFTNTEIEYFVDTDPGVGNAIDIPVGDADTLLLHQKVLAQNNLAIGEHNLFIRTKGSNGVWSVTNQKKFNVCTNYGALSIMDFHIETNKVFFTNLSEYNNHTKWDFGDGTIDTFLNPIKTYAAAGNYTVKLISTNECRSDTQTMIISIHGLQKINATKSGNEGIATVFFEGNGFTNTAVLKLKKGGIEILPVDLKYISPARIAAFFDLNGVEVGSYDVIGLLGGGVLDTIKNGFVVEPGKPTFVRLSDNGGNRGRFNRVRPVFGLQNEGNEDAIMVPVSFSLGYNPDFTNITFTEISEKFVDLSTLPFFQNTLTYLSANNISTDNVSQFDFDTIRNRHLYTFCKIKVPTEGFVMTSFKHENPGLHPSYNLGMLTQPPMFSSGIAINMPDSTDIRDCVSSFMKKAVRNNVNVEINQVEWDECFNVAYDSLRSVVHHLVRDFDLNKKAIPFKAIYSSFLVNLSQCSGSGVPSNLTNAQFSKIIKDFTYNWLYLENLDSIGRPCVDTTDNFVFQTIEQVGMGENRMFAQSRSVPGCNGGAAGAFPELAEMCSLLSNPDDRFEETFLANNGLGKKIFKKLLKAIVPKPPGGGVGGGLGLTTAFAKCKDFCESASFDPNDKYGPGDNDQNIYINHLGNYGYRITFENLAAATANAAYVEIVDTLDTEAFNVSSFQIGNLGWGDSTVIMDANRNEYSFLKDLRPAHPNYLRVDIRLDTLSGEASWKFYTLDTTTLQLTSDPNQGFLPPNNINRVGEGFITFNIEPKQGVTSGQLFDNDAKIIFDDNAPIFTQSWMHVADTTKPASMVTSLPSFVPTNNFNVQWTASDLHSGIEGVKTYVSINDSLYRVWKSFTTMPADTFHGIFGYTYKFFSIAKDQAGNFESHPVDFVPDAITTPLAVGQVISVNHGLWHDPATWSNNQVPNINTDLIVRHNVNVEQDAVCKKATLIQPGHLQIFLGKRLDIDSN